MIFFTFFLFIHLAYQQPCDYVTEIVDGTEIVGSCASDTPDTSATDFDITDLGGAGINEGIQKFSISLWIKPQPPTANGPIYSIFRVTENAADIIPSTTDGVRFALYLHSDSSNIFNRGLKIGYSETPLTFHTTSDLTTFLFSYTGNKWIYIFAGQDITRGEMVVFAWETNKDASQQASYQASRVEFNTPFTTNLMVNLLYWGTYQRFCGSIKKVHWIPNYFEKNQHNLWKMPYYFEGQTSSDIFLYKFEVDQASGDTNLVTTNTITYNQVNYFGYTYLDGTEKKITLESGKFPYTDKAFTFSIQYKFDALPVSGQNIRLFQRKAGTNNKLAISISREASGKNGIVLELETNEYVIGEIEMNFNEWYFLMVSFSFADALEEQDTALAFYHLIGADQDYGVYGYYMTDYASDWDSSQLNGDSVTLGSASNIYPGEVGVRHASLQTGFSYFSGENNQIIQCMDNCYLGQVTQDDTKLKCLVCDPATFQLNDFTCSDTACDTNYYLQPDVISWSLCLECKVDGQTDFYVNVIGDCIQSQCQNGFQETLEQCDDNNATNNDGCDDTCMLEIGFDCTTVIFQLTTCVRLCGNGAEDKQPAAPPYVYTEQCDDANQTSGDGCDADCNIEEDLWECLPYFPSVCTPLCGNSKLNDDGAKSQTETCDDGNTSNGDGCDSTCQIEATWECQGTSLQQSFCNLICGNGKRDGAEECDDGNLTNGDGCTNCIKDAGYICSGGEVPGQTDQCLKLCGNGVLEPANGEVCDDGNGEPFDGCTNCLVDMNWVCDGGSPTLCNNCGNGKREVVESCDDGNNNLGDGCENCAITPGWICNGDEPDLCGNCGNGKKEAIEDCDDGNNTPNDGCTNCTIDPFYLCYGGSPTTKDTCIIQCPNGQIGATETCDDGNSIDNDGCTDCQVDSGWVCINEPSICSVDVCGDGMKNNADECDDGNLDDGDGCSSICKIEAGWMCLGGGLTKADVCQTICGDGLNVQEDCDDGNLIDDDGCSRSCKVELGWECIGGDSTQKDTCKMVCGNNERKSPEQCDDGNKRNNDGCSTKCIIETGFGCKALPLIDPSSPIRDECFKCVKNCAICTENTVEGCSLCHIGYYRDLLTPVEDRCVDACPDYSYGNYLSQNCEKCNEECKRCFDDGAESCYNCANDRYLHGTKCLNVCLDGYFSKYNDLKGNWCRKCPESCLLCVSDKECSECVDYYSLHPISLMCMPCNLGDKCLSCDLLMGYCTVCVVGYVPIKDQCILIEDNCGDGYVSLQEECDDNNNANGDGCSKSCTIEKGWGCRLKANQGPSECYDILGWDFSLQTFILDGTIVNINFRDPITYDPNAFFGYQKLFKTSIQGFTSSDYNLNYTQINNQTVQIKFYYKKNVISQQFTLELEVQDVLVNQYEVQVHPDKTIVKVQLEDVEYYTDDERDQFEFFAKVVLYLQTFNWILVGGSAFLGQNLRMWKIMEILQVASTLYYVNIHSYPLNNEMMFEYLSYNNFYLIPNWLESNTEDYPSSLRRFMYSRMTYYVLNNSGGRFLMGLIASILMYLFVKLSYYRYLIKIFEIFLDKLEFSYFIKFYELFLLDLLVSSLHNIYYNSMGSNWKGTNTIFSFIFLFIIAFVQIGSLVLVFFKQHLGTEKEVETMLSTLHDGQIDSKPNSKALTFLIRAFTSQVDFIKKALIAYAIVYYTNDPFTQIIMIMVPRGVFLLIQLVLIEEWLVRFKEFVLEGLLLGCTAILFQFHNNNFIGDLQAKIQTGWILEYLVIAILSFHGLIGIFIVWKLLKILELTLPGGEIAEGLNKQVDLFRLKPKKVKKQDIFDDDIDAKIKNDEMNLNEEDRIYRDMVNKNKDRDNWNVWNMNKDLQPNEQRFVPANLGQPNFKPSEESEDSQEESKENKKLDENENVINVDQSQKGPQQQEEQPKSEESEESQKEEDPFGF